MANLSGRGRPSLLGVAVGILSAAAYGGMSYIVHAYGTELPATEVIFSRAVFAIFALAPFAFRDRRSLISGRSRPLWLRSFFGAISMLCFTWNLQHTSIGFANVLFNFAPLGVLVFAWVSKSERLTFLRGACLVLVTGGGVIFWSDAPPNILGKVCLVGLSGALAASISYTLLKRAAEDWSPLTLAWAMSVLSVPVTLLLKHGEWVPLRSTLLLPLMAIGALCTIGQISLALSYRWAELSTATAIVPSGMAWGVVFDAISGSGSAPRQLIGCLIYLVGCIPLVAMRAVPSAIPAANSIPETDSAPEIF